MKLPIILSFIAAALVLALPTPTFAAPADAFAAARTSPVPGRAVLDGRPDRLEPVVDPYYGGLFVRISGEPGTPVPGGRDDWPRRVRPGYSSYQSWNADASLIYLRTSDLLLETDTFRAVRMPELPGLPNWSPTEPMIMFAATETGVGKFHVLTGEQVDAVRLPGFHDFRFQTRTSPSYDGRRVGVKARRTGTGEWVCIGVDFASRRVGPVVDFDDFGYERGRFAEPKARRCSASATGRHLVLNGYARGSYNDQARAFDWRTGELTMTQRPNKGRECPGGHGDLGVTPEGEDVLVGICKGGGLPWSRPYKQQTVALRLRDGKVEAIGRGFGHVSCRNSARPGWCYASSFVPGKPIAALRLDGGRIEYYGEPQQTKRYSYDFETQAVPSPDGTRIAFSTSWNGLWRERPRTFVLDLAPLVAGVAPLVPPSPSALAPAAAPPPGEREASIACAPASSPVFDDTLLRRCVAVP